MAASSGLPEIHMQKRGTGVPLHMTCAELRHPCMSRPGPSKGSDVTLDNGSSVPSVRKAHILQRDTADRAEGKDVGSVAPSGKGAGQHPTPRHSEVYGADRKCSGYSLSDGTHGRCSTFFVVSNKVASVSAGIVGRKCRGHAQGTLQVPKTHLLDRIGRSARAGRVTNRLKDDMADGPTYTSSPVWLWSVTGHNNKHDCTV